MTGFARKLLWSCLVVGGVMFLQDPQSFPEGSRALAESRSPASLQEADRMKAYLATPAPSRRAAGTRVAQGYGPKSPDQTDDLLLRNDNEKKQAPAAKPTGPEKGTPAPDFTLHAPNLGPPVSLSSFRGKRPVALIFGSYS